jgi:mono/diheme cytochrome c family protein
MEEKSPNKKFKLSLITVLLTIAFAIWLVVTLAYINKIPEINRMTPEDVIKVITKDTAREPELDVIKGTPIPGVNVMDIGYPNDKLLSRGAEVFKNTCASCHGEKGLGDGPGGANLTPKPRNFSITEGWKNSRSIVGMFRTMVEGIPGSAMVAYEFLPIEDRFAVIHFIRNLIGGYPVIAPEELKQLDDIYDLASPRLSNSQITMKTAERIIKADNKVVSDAINAIIERIAGNQTEQGILFRAVSADQTKVINTLLRTSAWRNDYNTFVQIVTTNTIRNGFKPSVMKLSKDDMNSLYGFMKFAVN